MEIGPPAPWALGVSSKRKPPHYPVKSAMIGHSGQASGGPLLPLWRECAFFELALPNVIILKAVNEGEWGLGVDTAPYAGDRETSVILHCPEHETA